jgi:hypothetical protein
MAAVAYSQEIYKETNETLTQYTHTTAVVTAAAGLEGMLELAIRSKMRPLKQKMTERLFEGYGPLSSFAAKIDLAYALDITSTEINEELNKVRKIRNKFAHSIQAINLGSDEIRPLSIRSRKAIQQSTIRI